MFKGQGKSVFQGAAVGPVFELKVLKGTSAPSESHGEESEKDRFISAKKVASSQLQAICDKVKAETGEKEAAIMDVQMIILKDQDLDDSVFDEIEKGLGAYESVEKAGIKFSQFFKSLDDPYMRNRSSDVLDLTKRLLSILSGENSKKPMTEPSVLVSDDLTPSETASLDKNMILAIVVRNGSLNSHAAILARAMNIPSIIEANLPDEPLDGRIMAVDGSTGEFFIDPDEDTVAAIKEKSAALDRKKRDLEKLKGLPSVTMSGKKVRLYANIKTPDDVAQALQEDAEGIGLFRSEFIFMGKDDWPAEEEQFQAYRQAVEGMKGRPVVIRTVDIGADKKVAYLRQGAEDNPALGYRGIRIGLKNPEILKTQLRAIYRASAFGPVSVMFPLIVSLEETKKAMALADEALSEVRSRGLEANQIERGVMIETPASVMISEALSEIVDFFSVGTNDLTQYTLAMDRQNRQLEGLFDPHHPAILEMLRITAQNAKKGRIWCGICGELAGDLELTDEFLKMGYDELSVSPPFILGLRKKIRESSF